MLNKRTNSNTPKKRIICHLYWSENFNGCFVALFCSVALFKRMWRRFWLVCGFIYSVISSYAGIDIVFDYSYDTTNWFGNEQRYIMDQAAYAFESRLGSESFGSLIPSDYAGTAGNNYYLNSSNPVTGSQLLIDLGSTTSEGNVVGTANTIIIFPGAGAASGGTNAWASGHYWPKNSGSDNTASSDKFIEYLDNVRDTATNYDSVGGTISVNSNRAWYFDTDLTDYDYSTNKMDFYSTMVHEIGHLMGFRKGSDAWSSLVENDEWTGANGMAAYGGNPIPMQAGGSHFDYTDFNQSHTLCNCHPSMDPYSSVNQRSPWTETDFAVLKDLGYAVSASPTGPGSNNANTFTDTSWQARGTSPLPIREDYATWIAANPDSGSGGFVTTGSAAPEPAYIFTLMGGLLAFIGGRKNLGKIKTLLRIS